jgi:A/G-specific adenine glycosylase
MRKDSQAKKIWITQRLLRWYDEEKRNLPWRKTRNPYRIWVSEIMLQQTQVDTVIPYYRRFLKAFPTVKALAGASLDDVLKMWENLGYYSRARNLHAAACVIVERFGGKFPATFGEILSLPGIGPYTAGAILSIAYGEPVAAVDGNVRRVIARLFALKDSLDGPRVQKRIERLAGGLLPEGRAGDFNQALMDLGATICIPKGPRCDHCPVNILCRAKAKGIQDSIPRAAKRKPLPHKDMTAAVINRGKNILVVRRPGKGLLGGLWKFPGGLREKEETLNTGLRRDVREETGFSVRTGEALAKVDHAYTHFRVTLHAFRCTIRKEMPRRPGSTETRWIGVAELRTLAFSKADRELIKLVFAGERKAKKMV